MERKTLERIAWLRTPQSGRGKGTSVSVELEGKKVMVPLAALKMPALRKYAKSLGIKC